LLEFSERQLRAYIAADNILPSTKRFSDGLKFSMEQAIFALVGVLVGAFATGGVQHYFWRLEERQREDRARREQKEKIAERLSRTAGELIELARSPIQGPHIDQTYLTTVSYIELHRLKRELANAVASASGAFPQQQERLRIFQRQTDASVLLNPPKERMDQLRSELDALLKNL